MDHNEVTRQQSYVPTPPNSYKKSSPVKELISFTKNKIISLFRKGPESVIFIPTISRGGNWLYEWAAADRNLNKTGNLTYIVRAPGMDNWISEFPDLGVLTKNSSKIKFRDKRIIGHHQEIRKQFSHEDLESFIRNRLSSESFRERQDKARKLISPETLIINIRRGDYYSNPEINKNFGIDTTEYVDTAIKLFLQDYKPDKIMLVSDDLEWCKNNLGFLSEIAPVSYEKFGSSMFDDLALISVAQNIILTNTTFGYWGAYIATVLYNSKVYVPNIHQKDLSDYYRNLDIPMQHLSCWTQVKPDAPRQSWIS